jgi:hypothetical protein
VPQAQASKPTFRILERNFESGWTWSSRLPAVALTMCIVTNLGVERDPISQGVQACKRRRGSIGTQTSEHSMSASTCRQDYLSQEAQAAGPGGHMKEVI